MLLHNSHVKSNRKTQSEAGEGTFSQDQNQDLTPGVKC